MTIQALLEITLENDKKFNCTFEHMLLQKNDFWIMACEIDINDDVELVMTYGIFKVKDIREISKNVLCTDFED